ncbi:MAG: hypothetical protein ABEJ40_09005 [Haloarculaceae archaeon]
MRARVALVCTLVLLAGCGAVPFGGDAAGPTRDGTVTPVPIDSPTPTETPTAVPDVDPPPGVALDAPVDVDRLVRAHEAVVAATSYTWELRYRATSEPGRTVDRWFVRRAAVDPDRFLLEHRNGGRVGNQTLYVEGDVGYLRTTNGPRREYEVIEDPEEPEQYTVSDEVLRQFLSNQAFDVERIERDGETFYRLYAVDNPPPAQLEAGVTTVWNYTVTAYVEPSGLVRSLAVEYDKASGDYRQHVSFRFDYTAVGRTNVTEPDWVATVTPGPPPTDGSGNPTVTGPVESPRPTTTDGLDAETGTRPPPGTEPGNRSGNGTPVASGARRPLPALSGPRGPPNPNPNPNT